MTFYFSTMVEYFKKEKKENDKTMNWIVPSIHILSILMQIAIAYWYEVRIEYYYAIIMVGFFNLYLTKRDQTRGLTIYLGYLLVWLFFAFSHLILWVVLFTALIYLCIHTQGEIQVYHKEVAIKERLT